jgi:DNA helicase-2/ATP-dependent DNA helicase PcrA
MLMNKQQQQVVDHPGGPLLVLACPGSGKTRCITQRITRLLDEDVSPSNILAVTFTNKAAKEMAERVKEMGYGHKLAISTFHSFCVKVLRKCCHLKGYKRNFSICDDSAQKSLFTKLVKAKGLNPKDWKYNPRYLISILEGKKNQLLTDEEFELGFKEEYVEIFRGYQKTLKMSNTMDFGDLIYNVVKIFEENPRVRDGYAIKFEHLLVDEMQDTNKAQLELVKHLASYHNNVIAVGDICQSIYGWRGACIDNIVKFEEHFKNANTAYLGINYRSTPEILSAAEKLIKQNKGNLKVKLEAKRDSNNEPPSYKVWKQPENEAEGIAKKIQALRWKGYDYKEMAILCRINALTRTFEESFRRKEIPYVLLGTFGFYDRKEVKDSIAFMKFLSNPEDAISFEQIINVPARGVGPATLIKILEYASENNLSFTEACKDANNIKGVRKNAASSLNHFVYVLEGFDKRDPYDSLVKIFEDSGFLDHFRATDQSRNEHREENVLEFLRGFHGYCKRTAKPSVAQYLQEVMLMTSSDKDTSDDAVRVMTCHAAKGLEFDIVFIPGMEEDMFPHKRSIAENNIAEERRVAYVAVTRARYQLHLSGSQIRVGDGAPLRTIPSRFLVDMDIIDKEDWELNLEK